MHACRRCTSCWRRCWKCPLPQRQRRQPTARSTSRQRRPSRRAGLCLMVCHFSFLGDVLHTQRLHCVAHSRTTAFMQIRRGFMRAKRCTAPRTAPLLRRRLRP